MGARFFAASLVIISSMAAATAISALVFISDVFGEIPVIPGVTPKTTEPEPGKPRNILILGSDVRAGEKSGRSDTTVLLRVDPDADRISLLSIPRDLRVAIPGYGRDKFNAAYSYGGAPLTLEVVKRLTGLPIHHVINVDFTGFADAVNAINCVFIDVDRRYYVPEGSTYSAIDPPIEAGYQKLCGLKALQYVRYRLEDNDLVRAARQQDFVREARQKVEPGKLVLDSGYRFELLEVLTDHTSSDARLKDTGDLIEFTRTFVEARNAVVDEVHFPAELGESYVTVDEAALESALAEFIGAEQAPHASTPRQEPEGPADSDRPRQPDAPELIDAEGAARDQTRRLAEITAGNGKPIVGFPVLFPTRLVPGSAIDDDSRAFPIDGPREYHGYKFVIAMPGSGRGLTTEYYGLSGTDWADPPILENESDTRTIDGREYLLFNDGDRLRMVAWKTEKASYWVSNSLLQTLEEADMLEIAASAHQLDG